MSRHCLNVFGFRVLCRFLETALLLCFLAFPGNVLALENQNPADSDKSNLEDSQVATKSSGILPPDIRKLREALKEGSPAFAEDEIQEFFPAVLTEVEKFAGKKFKSIPSFKIADRKDLYAALKADILPQLKNLLPTATADEVDKMAQLQSSSMTPFMLGKYGFQGKILYLLPGNFLSIFRLAKMDEKHMKSVAKLIVAHELTHALQDQEIDLRKSLQFVKNQEQSLAFNAMIEGHAMHVMEAVGRKLNLSATIIETAKLFSAGSVKFDDPALQILNQVMSSQYESIYVRGKRFIEFFAKKGGNDEIWKVMANPPQKTSMIMDPKTYSSLAEESGFDLAVILEGLEKHLGKPPYKMQKQEIGVISLHAVYAPMDPKMREEVLANFDKAFALVVISSTTQSIGNISLFTWKDPAKVKMTINLLEEMGKRSLEKIRTGSSFVKISDVEISDFKPVAVDISRKFSFVIKCGEDEKVKQTIYRFVKNQLMIEVIDQNVGLSEKTLNEICQTIIERFAEASTSAKPKEEP